MRPRISLILVTLLMLGTALAGPGSIGGVSRAAAQAAFPFELTIDTPASVDPRTGMPTITGTVTCSLDGIFFIFIEMTQTTGFARTDDAGIVVETPCFAGVPVDWEMQIGIWYGSRFRAGQATIQGSADFHQGSDDDTFRWMEITPSKILLTGRR